MSLKTRILLQRGGRDQFGDPGDAYVCRSPGLTAAEKSDYHSAVTTFFNEQWPAWERFCSGKSSHQIWSALFLRTKPAFSTFERQRRAFVSLSEFLKYVLVLYRWHALMAMGHPYPAAKLILSRHATLSRYLLEPQIGQRKPGRTPGYVPRVE